MSLLKKVFPKTIPVLITYFFLGIGFGVLVKSMGYGSLMSLLMSGYIYAGAMQFATLGLFQNPFQIFDIILLALSVNLRYLFYSISFIHQLKGTATWKQLLIYHFCSDESYSLYLSPDRPEGIKLEDYMLGIGFLNFIYWIGASVLGVYIGTIIPIDATGIDFMMTALFVIIVMDQWESRGDKFPTLLGFGASILCLLLFGPQNFILPSMFIILVGNLLHRRRAGK